MRLVISPALVLLLSCPALGQDSYKPAVKGGSDEGLQAIEQTVVAEGYRVELFAAEPLLANPVVFAIDRGLRFYVAETFRLHAGVTDMRSHMNWLDDELACETVEDRVEMMARREGDRFEERYAVEHERIKLVWDADGDGLAETSTVFADGFNEPGSGIAAGVLPLGDDVYYACIPDLWVLRDEDGDGRSDTRRSLHDGWGVHIALLGHDMHGLQRGPDGRLYWSIGDRGFHVEHEGKVFAHAHAGAVLRSELDGSGLEVFSTGLRNPQELCFDDHGNLWTGDNNSDGGDRARWTYVLQGAEIGWRHAFQYVNYPNSRGPWNAEKIWHPPHDGQPAYHLPCVANFSDGPSGLAYYPGTGLGPEWKEHFFLCDFRGGPRNSGVHAFRVEPRGAGFELVDPKKFLWNCLPTDVDFGPDGNLYFSDWVNGWGMTGKGRIYRVTSDAHADERTEVHGLLGGDMTHRESGELGRLLAHANQRVRLEAQWALSERGASDVLLASARGRFGPGPARLHGIWGLGHLARLDPSVGDHLLEEVSALHGDEDDEVRAQVAALLGDLRWPKGSTLAIDLLTDDSARVRGMAAQALGRIARGQPSSERAFEVLVEALASNADSDPWLRHQVVWALVGLAGGSLDGSLPRGGEKSPSWAEEAVERLTLLSGDDRPAVRRGAVVALRRLGLGEVAIFLGDEDPSIVSEAARAIYDVPLDGAMESLALMLADRRLARQNNSSVDHYLIRRALLANRRLGGQDSADRIGTWLRGGGHPKANREAVEILRDWDVLSPRDPMTGEWRPVSERTLAEVRPAVESLAGSAVTGDLDVAGQRAWVITLEKHPGSRAARELPGIAMDHGRHWEVRREALEAVLRSKASDQGDVLAAAFSDPDGRVRAIAYQELGAQDPERAVSLLKAALEAAPAEERGAAIHALGQVEHPGAAAALRTEALVAAGKGRRSSMLEVMEALEARQDQEGLANLELSSQRAVGVEESLESVAGHLYALGGGDVEAGKRIFLEKTETSCLRCHAFSDKGGSEVGPDLTHIAERLTRPELLLAVLDPNAEVAEEFENWVMALDDGTVVSGRILSEDPGRIVLETPQKEVLELEPSAVEARRRDQSSMPQDVASHLSRREIRDLVAFLSAQD